MLNPNSERRTSVLELTLSRSQQTGLFLVVTLLAIYAFARAL